MINPIVNAVVIALFGFTIGTVLALLMALQELYVEPMKKEVRVSHRSLKAYFGAVQEAADEGRKGWTYLPRSGRLFMAAFYGLIIVFVLFVTLSPLEMRWWVFFLSLAIGLAVTYHLFQRAIKGKIRATGKSLFDVLPEENEHKN